MIGLLGLAWVSVMRRRYRCAEALNKETLARLEDWFDDELLNSAQLARSQRIQLLGASLARLLGMRGLPLEPTGICLGRLIVIEDKNCDYISVLFHELVHSVQWRALGGRRFLSMYLREVIRDGYLSDHGLEAMARVLTERFARGERFKVKNEVRRELTSGTALFEE